MTQIQIILNKFVRNVYYHFLVLSNLSILSKFFMRAGGGGNKNQAGFAHPCDCVEKTLIFISTVTGGVVIQQC